MCWDTHCHVAPRLANCEIEQNCGLFIRKEAVARAMERQADRQAIAQRTTDRMTSSRQTMIDREQHGRGVASQHITSCSFSLLVVAERASETMTQLNCKLAST